MIVDHVKLYYAHRCPLSTLDCIVLYVGYIPTEFRQSYTIIVTISYYMIHIVYDIVNLMC